MTLAKTRGRLGAAAVLTAAALAGVALMAREGTSSDHVDTAEVELSPQLDLNDVYVFPGSADNRIVLVMNVASPINLLGRNVTRFDPNALYQFKIDNNNDATEDLVLQFLFDEMSDGTSRVNVLGPAAPAGPSLGQRNRLLGGPLSANNAFNTTFTTANGMTVFTGPRNDPFYIDLEQFLQIVPDRRPATFLTHVATDAKMPTAFCGPTAPFDISCTPKDFLQGANTLSIVVEMPESMLGVAAGNDAKLGIWATIGR
ncbi:MAG: hypothetical protein AVDCRST_MAG89-4719 [uncultured Gemmatimonadetes bacterium]|uniref:DUF4331 domain-containing protein n=1 Tax=uncultured Gemmatimonadota bacterium TaxID=203437 RepID=A0A6J4N1M7_9BACT|nr:MAG: hypothetical protein AVDCRST_MAG89-4719 [uncultured Gemmatimonadota bacterium]